MLGRRTVIDNADTGRTVTVFDPAPNAVKKVIAKLAAAKKAITYATRLGFSIAASVARS